MKGLKIIDLEDIEELKEFLQIWKKVPIHEHANELFQEIYGWAEMKDFNIIDVHFVPVGNNLTRIVVLYTK